MGKGTKIMVNDVTMTHLYAFLISIGIVAAVVAALTLIWLIDFSLKESRWGNVYEELMDIFLITFFCSGVVLIFRSLYLKILEHF